MRIFKSKWFARFAHRDRISDEILRQTIQDAERKPDADLEGGVIKQRLARADQG